MKDLAQDTSQLLFRNSFRQHNSFRKRTAPACAMFRLGSSTVAAALRAFWFLDAVQPSSDCALPHDSARERRVLKTRHHENTNTTGLQYKARRHIAE